MHESISSNINKSKDLNPKIFGV